MNMEGCIWTTSGKTRSLDREGEEDWISHPNYGPIVARIGKPGSWNHLNPLFHEMGHFLCPTCCLILVKILNESLINSPRFLTCIFPSHLQLAVQVITFRTWLHWREITNSQSNCTPLGSSAMHRLQVFRHLQHRLQRPNMETGLWC